MIPFFNVLHRLWIKKYIELSILLEIIIRKVIRWSFFITYRFLDSNKDLRMKRITWVSSFIECLSEMRQHLYSSRKYDICKRLYLSCNEIVRSTTQSILLTTQTSFDFSSLHFSSKMVLPSTKYDSYIVINNLMFERSR